jgi:hypothetical protein
VKTTLRGLALGALLVTLCGCDPDSTISFDVVNETDLTASVNVLGPSGTAGINTLAPGATRTVTLPGRAGDSVDFRVSRGAAAGGSGTCTADTDTSSPDFHARTVRIEPNTAGGVMIVCE